jgi:hypothetical protein
MNALKLIFKNLCHNPRVKNNYLYKACVNFLKETTDETLVSFVKEACIYIYQKGYICNRVDKYMRDEYENYYEYMRINIKYVDKTEHDMMYEYNKKCEHLFCAYKINEILYKIMHETILDVCEEYIIAVGCNAEQTKKYLFDFFLEAYHALQYKSEELKSSQTRVFELYKKKKNKSSEKIEKLHKKYLKKTKKCVSFFTKSVLKQVNLL